MKMCSRLVPLLAAACAAFGQPSSNSPSFEVASVKPSAPQPMGHIRVMMGGDPGRINYANVSLKNVLMRAYEVRSYQIGGPSWLDSERYDIVAKVPDGTPREQVSVMLQNLLAERFRMKVHRETKEQSVYALVVGKNGPKLKASEQDDAKPDPSAPAHSGAPARRRGTFMVSNNGHLELKGATLAALSDMLSNMMDKPVVDTTGLKGEYDIVLDVSPDDLAGMRKTMGPEGGHGANRPPGEASPAPDSAPAASIFTAIQALGLKLEPRKAPVEYIVVDQANKVPTEN